MRRAKRAEFATIWTATIETVWRDLPEDEKARLDRGPWEGHIRKRLEPYVESDRTEAWVTESSDGTFLGYVLVGPGGGYLTPETHGFIYDVWVAPTHRGRGIGTALVRWATDWARSKGYAKIKLEVAETNAAARRVYEAAGFRPERAYMGLVLETAAHSRQSREPRAKG